MNPTFAYVKWLDAQMEGHWLDKIPAPDEDLAIYSIGWLLHESDDRVILLQSLGDGTYGNALHIPKGMIQELVKVELK
jgi:hypothetical protein